MNTATSKNQINKDMPIAEILKLAPDSVEIMLNAGLHCVGCGANTMETLAEGMIGHGFSEEEIYDLVDQINDLSEPTKTEGKTQKQNVPEVADITVIKIQEGNKTYYKLAGLMFSKNAYKNLHNLANGKPGLKIRVEAGGCSGYSNKYDFADDPDDDEKTYHLSDTLALYLNDFTFDKLYGSVIDYETGLHGSGLKFHNPNVKKQCHCGTSFGF